MFISVSVWKGIGFFEGFECIYENFGINGFWGVGCFILVDIWVIFICYYYVGGFI